MIRSRDFNIVFITRGRAGLASRRSYIDRCTTTLWTPGIHVGDDRSTFHFNNRLKYAITARPVVRYVTKLVQN